MSAATYECSQIEEIRASFKENGFVKVETGLSHKLLEGAKSDLSRYFGPNRITPSAAPFADENRVQDAWRFSQNVYETSQCGAIRNILNELYGTHMDPFQTLNFYRGTAQPIHSDTIHFNSEPFGAMCGVWVALEDVGLDQGPLEYYPGSQITEEMNLDFFNIDAGEASSYNQYLTEIEKIIKREGYKKEFGVLKKGEAIVWSANIFHGGSPLLNEDTTRQSQVTHYYARGVRYWRPQQSIGARRYFTPTWVVDVNQAITKNPVKRAYMECRSIFLRFRDDYQHWKSR